MTSSIDSKGNLKRINAQKSSKFTVKFSLPIKTK